MTPMLAYEDPGDPCMFYKRFPSTTTKLTDFIIPTLPSENTYYSDGRVRGNKASIAMRVSGKWIVEEAFVSFSKTRVTVECVKYIGRDAYAFPIDPRMTRMDIEGADRIFANSTNDGWLFGHSESDEHHDRAYQLESIMTTLFQDAIDVKMQQVMASIVNPSRSRPIIGDSGSGGTQRANYIHWDALVRFRKECVKWCLEFEKLLHIGKHIQESDLHIHHQLLRAINQAKRVWTLDQSKKDSLDTISADVTAITAKINTIHTFETRWEKAARREAEAKKAAAESSSDSGGEASE